MSHDGVMDLYWLSGPMEVSPMFRVHYWAIVISLALLSAYLLLSKPQKASKSNPETVTTKMTSDSQKLKSDRHFSDLAPLICIVLILFVVTFMSLLPYHYDWYPKQPEPTPFVEYSVP